MNSSGRKKEYTRITIAAIVFVGLAVLYAGSYMYLDAARKDVQEYKQILASKSDRENSGRTVSDLLRRTEAERTTLKQHLLLDDNKVQVIEQIENVIALSNVDSATKDFVEKGDAVHFEIATTGSFADTMYFLRLLETLPYRVDVTRAYSEQIRSNKTDQSAKWRGNFELTLFGYNLDS